MKMVGTIDSTTEEMTTEIAIVDEATIRDKIYEVRGVQVMIDFELAEIYGYTTKRFNEQVKNNIKKFDDDFRFRITREELDDLMRSKKTTSPKRTFFQGQSGGTRYLPWCFTESGVYMLMTVLRGDLAIKQSKALIRIFRSMKEYIAGTQGLVTQRDMLRLSMQTSENTEAIHQLQSSVAIQKKQLQTRGCESRDAFVDRSDEEQSGAGVVITGTSESFLRKQDYELIYKIRDERVEREGYYLLIDSDRKIIGSPQDAHNDDLLNLSVDPKELAQTGEMIKQDIYGVESYVGTMMFDNYTMVVVYPVAEAWANWNITMMRIIWRSSWQMYREKESRPPCSW